MSFAEQRVESIKPIFRAVRAFSPSHKSEILRREFQSNAARSDNVCGFGKIDSKRKPCLLQTYLLLNIIHIFLLNIIYIIIIIIK